MYHYQHTEKINIILLTTNQGYLLLKFSNNTGTYLIQDGKPQLPIDKSTCNHTLEIFSGDVIQFGQGNLYYTIYSKNNFHDTYNHN